MQTIKCHVMLHRTALTCRQLNKKKSVKMTSLQDMQKHIEYI